MDFEEGNGPFTEPRSRRERPITALRVVPSFLAICAALKPSASSACRRLSRAGVQLDCIAAPTHACAGPHDFDLYNGNHTRKTAALQLPSGYRRGGQRAKGAALEILHRHGFAT